jgi:hypothetical protein
MRLVSIRFLSCHSEPPFLGGEEFLLTAMHPFYASSSRQASHATDSPMPTW